MYKTFIPAASLFVVAAFAATPASAIECQGNFQVQGNGNMISTPYCQDGYLAVVAREYGLKVSAEDIRRNPSIKGSTCRFIGEDNRVRTSCDQDRGNRPFGR